MSDNKNLFERRRDLATQAISRAMKAADESFGVGQRPYGTVKLSGAEQAQRFKEMAPEEQAATWDGMDEGERKQLQQHLGG